MRLKVLEAAIASVLDLPGDFVSFRARVRHFRNLGLPRTDRPGKGQIIEYGRKDAFELLIALQLNVMGVSPRTAADAAWLIMEEKRPRLTGEDEQFYDVLLPPPLEPLTFRCVGLEELMKELGGRFKGRIVLNTTELANLLSAKIDELESGDNGDGNESE